MARVPQWHARGDWFDVCSCHLPCPCIFAQPPTNNACEGVLAWHVRDGRYGDVVLDGLNVLAVSYFEGNIWGGETRAAIGMFLDERADDRQREALQMIFGGRAGGWPAKFAELIGDMRGAEFVPIRVEVAADLGQWRAEIPNRVQAYAEALTGPTTPSGTRVQLHHAPGSETGPGQVATWGQGASLKAQAFGFSFEFGNRSSKHIPFDWSGPDASRP